MELKLPEYVQLNSGTIIYDFSNHTRAARHLASNCASHRGFKPARFGRIEGTRVYIEIADGYSAREVHRELSAAFEDAGRLADVPMPSLTDSDSTEEEDVAAPTLEAAVS